MHNLVFAIFLKKQYRYISVSFLIFFPLSFLQEKIQEPIIVLTMNSSLRKPIIVTLRVTMNNIKERLNEILKKMLIFSNLSVKEVFFLKTTFYYLSVSIIHRGLVFLNMKFLRKLKNF